MAQYIKRKGQIVNNVMPSYRVIQEFEHFFLASYCGVWKDYWKDEYELITQDEKERHR